ncbi:echinoderm microtubule-associated protein-like CG42247 [Palaemon carinicauda]|uniref:echinoderm microtubule-associated protein-like CG42247 n=1 Tax=Palaemon carinicauda TaxID=392227 RepID=UPI0035B6561C
MTPTRLNKSKEEERIDSVCSSHRASALGKSLRPFHRMAMIVKRPPSLYIVVQRNSTEDDDQGREAVLFTIQPNENGEYVVSGPQGNDLYDKDRQMSLPPLSSHPPIPNGDVHQTKQGATPRRRRPRAQSILSSYINGHLAGPPMSHSRRSSAVGITKSKDDSRIHYELPIEVNEERARLPADPWRARKVRFYRNGDRYYHGYEFVFKPGRDVVNMEALCDKISDRIGLIKGARYIFGLDGRRKYRIEELEDGQAYVASSDRKFVNLGYGRQRPDWNQNALAGTPNALAERQGPGRRGDNSRTGSPVVREVTKKTSADSNKSNNSKPGSRDGRTIRILNNSDHSQERTVLVNMKTVNLWEEVVKDVGKMFKLTGPLRLLSVLGEEVKSFSQFKNDFADYDVFYVEQLDDASTPNNMVKSPRSNKSTPPSASAGGSGEGLENGLGGRRKSLNGVDDRRSSISERRSRSSSRRPTLRRYTSEPTLKETPEESDEYEEVTDRRSAVVTIRGQRRMLHAPKMPLRHNPAPPHQTLTLDWVYGYRGSDSRKNLWVLPSGELLYYVAAVAVIMDATDEVQRHYTEHTEDIQCMALHPTRDLVASGQRASRGNKYSAHVRVWSARTLATLHVLGRKELGAGILAVDFSRRNKGTYLLAVDADREHLLSVWTWDNELIFGRVATHQDHVLGAAFHPLDNNLIVTHGRGLLSLWARRKDGIFTRTDLIEQETSGRTITSLEFTPGGDLITGDHEGMITVWSIDPDGDYYVKREFQAHTTAVNCLQLLSEGTVLSGGDKDRRIIAWDCEEEFEKITETKLPEQAGGVRSLYPQRPGHNDGNIYVGTTRNMILEGSLQRRFNQVIFGHSKQLWGLAVNKADGTLATAGYDKHIVKWHENQLEWRIQAQSECVSVAVHPMGTRIAAGTIDGHLIVLNGQSGQHVTTVRVCGSPLSCLSYNPAGDTLAVGSQNGSIYLYKSTKDGYLYTRNGRMTGSLPLSGIDWSTSGRYLQTVTSDYDVAYWSLSDLSRVKNDEDVRNEIWSTQTCPLSYMVHGVWSGARDAPLQVTLDRSPRGDVVAAGDTDGYIRLYRYPVLSTRAGYHEYKVYTSYVSSVRFSYTDNYLYSIGDTDAALMRWRVT